MPHRLDRFVSKTARERVTDKYLDTTRTSWLNKNQGPNWLDKELLDVEKKAGTHSRMLFQGRTDRWKLPVRRHCQQTTPHCHICGQAPHEPALCSTPLQPDAPRALGPFPLEYPFPRDFPEAYPRGTWPPPGLPAHHAAPDRHDSDTPASEDGVSDWYSDE